MKKLPIYLLLLLSVYINAQIVNSNEKTIGEFYNADVSQFTLNGGKVELQFRLRTPKTENWFIKNSDPKIYSALKTRMLFLDVGLTNTKSFLNVNDFDFDAVGLKAGLTYQSSFNTILVDDLGNPMINKLTTWKVGGNIQFDRFKNFNPNTNIISNESPVTINLKAGVNFYRFNPSYFKKGTVIPNFNVQLTPLTYNSGSLQNYILSSNTITNNNIVFTKNKSFDGKYGVLENSNQTSFVSFSSPFIFDEKVFNTFHIAPIPHLSWQTANGAKPIYNIGIALGLLNKPVKNNEKIKDLKEVEIKDKNGRVIKKVKSRKFNVPSFLSFGIDWNHKGGKGSSPNYFITGSFSLD
jgi:hypothetical protein